jgi:bile acid:Na+ symporter, BASS family
MLDEIVKTLAPIALFFMMLAMGMELKMGDFRAIVREPRAAIAAFLCIFLLVPFIGFGVARLMVDTAPVIALGMVLLASCPSGALSNFFTYLARANVALSVAISVIANLVAVITVPILVTVGLSILGETAGTIQLPVTSALQQIVLMVLTPLLIGMLIRAWKPNHVDRAELIIRRISMVVFIVLLVGVNTNNWNFVQENIWFATPMLLLLAFMTVGVGWLLSWILRCTPADRFTVAAEVGIQNVALANVLAINILHRSELSIAPSIYALTCLAPVALLAFNLKRQRDRLSAQSPSGG